MSMKYGQPDAPQTQAVNDKASVGLQILSFLFPIAGWILWGVNRKEKPKAAKSYSTMAWIGFAVGFVLQMV